jgi:hypothetical protein
MFDRSRHMQDARTYRFADDRLSEALAALERLRGSSRMAAEPALAAIAEARHALSDALARPAPEGRPDAAVD